MSPNPGSSNLPADLWRPGCLCSGLVSHGDPPAVPAHPEECVQTGAITEEVSRVTSHVCQVPNQQCETVPKQNCEPVTRQVCEPVKRQQCRTVPRQQCSDQPQQQCQTVPRQQCNSVPQQQCQQVPKQNCVTVPRQQCRLVHSEANKDNYVLHSALQSANSRSVSKCPDSSASKFPPKSVNLFLDSSVVQYKGWCPDSNVTQCPDSSAGRL